MPKRRMPYIPLWVDDYQRDTRHLSLEQHGAYLLLLMEAWKAADSSLPDDDDFLAGITLLSRPRWLKIKPVVMAFWKLDGRSKRWVQKRLKKERRLAVGRKQKSADAAASRWKDNETPDAKTMPEGCHPFIPFKEKPNGFSARGARKNPGFVSVRKTTDAVNDFIQEIRDDTQRIGSSGEGSGGDVPMLPAKLAS